MHCKEQVKEKLKIATLHRQEFKIRTLFVRGSIVLSLIEAGGDFTIN